MTKTIQPVPADNKSHKGPGSDPKIPLDTTKGHRDDEKDNIREQGDHGNLVQNTSNKRSGRFSAVILRCARLRASKDGCTLRSFRILRGSPKRLALQDDGDRAAFVRVTA